jgi:putative acetyltransferase
LIEIRQERPDDVDAIREVNRLAFGQDHEGGIVDALRAAGAITLSLVAVSNAAVVGHILFSPLTIGDEAGAALGPMAVHPAHQRKGIGSRLVSRGLADLEDLGCPFVVVIGHPTFYPRFGFVPAGSRGLTCEWNVPPDVFMIRILNTFVGNRLQGKAQYRKEFSAVE